VALKVAFMIAALKRRQAQAVTLRARVAGGNCLGDDHGYDSGMTAAKIAISLAPKHLKRAREEVRAGRAASVSGHIARALEMQARRESLQALVGELIAEHGEPSKKDFAWARSVLRKT